MKDDGKDHRNDTLAIWNFYGAMEPGDSIYVKQGVSSIIGRGEITGDYEYHQDREHYQHIRTVRWIHKRELSYPDRLKSYISALGDISNFSDVIKHLDELFEIEGVPSPKTENTAYEKECFLADVYISEEKYDTLKGLLERKKNIILQGAPGVGKTFAAKRLTYSIMGEIDDDRIRTVQFHQSYSYEDFVMGYRPDKDGFMLSFGPFYEFCKDAEKDDTDRPWFFIIDEINRGNLSKIFGELLMLIEHDKRGGGHAIRLLYADEQFSVPPNVHIIGMMNTADRSLAMMDYALRRRFAFFDMEPVFESEGFRMRQSVIQNGKFDALVRAVVSLNREITEDVSLGKGFRIGHSYFCTSGVVDEKWLSDVVEYELIPLLEEYWFDEPTKVDNWSSRLWSAANGQ